MANKDAAFGFAPIGKIGGNAPGKLGEYQVAASQSALFQGDAVKPTGGYAVVATEGADVLGVFWGANYDDPTTNKPIFKNNLPSVAAVADVFVYDDPYQVFEVQGDGASARTELLRYMDIKVAGTGNSTTGISAQEAKVSTVGANGQLAITGVTATPGRNDIGSANLTYTCLLSEHTYANL